MRGSDEQTSHMFSYIAPEQRVRADHPLRAVRRLTDEVLTTLSPRFDRMYSDMGRPSIPPEQLLRALLLQSLYTIRSERLLMEEIDYSILFRWFVGLSMDDEIWSPTTFSKNRERLLQGDIAAAFFDAVVDQARQAGLLSDEHFTVDGTLLEAWASLKSFRRKDDGATEPPDDPGNPTVNFHGDSRRNDTHQSTTDPDALLARKGHGKEAKLSYAGHVLLDNRHGLVANVCVTAATGTAEREAALLLLGEAPDIGLGWEPTTAAKRPTPRRSAATRASTSPALLSRSARSASHRMWLRRTSTPRSMDGRLGIRATKSVNGNGS